MFLFVIPKLMAGETRKNSKGFAKVKRRGNKALLSKWC